MADMDKALATQIANIEKKTGKTMAQLAKIVKDSKLAKHGEIVTMLKTTLGMGHGDANTVVHLLFATKWVVPVNSVVSTTAGCTASTITATSPGGWSGSNPGCSNCCGT